MLALARTIQNSKLKIKKSDAGKIFAAFAIFCSRSPQKETKKTKNRLGAPRKLGSLCYLLFKISSTNPPSLRFGVTSEHEWVHTCPRKTPACRRRGDDKFSVNSRAEAAADGLAVHVERETQ
jgi:hypothetical protein